MTLDKKNTVMIKKSIYSNMKTLISHKSIHIIARIMLILLLQSKQYGIQIINYLQKHSTGDKHDSNPNDLLRFDNYLAC